MDQVKIGQFLSTVRREKGLTQEQLGERLGVSQRTVSRWETGRNMPDISMLPVICDELEINIAELMSGERIEGEQVAKSEVSNLARGLAALSGQKQNARKILGAALSLVITIVCMVGLYQYEFHINVDTTADLEAAIDAYHFNNELSSDVLERAAVGNRLYVLYGQNAYPGAGGLACLEKGIFGRYRILSCNDVKYPLCMVEKTRAAGRTYAVTFCVNELPGTAAYAVYGYGGQTRGQGLTVDDEGERLFSHPYTGSPFLTMTEIGKDIIINPFGTRYFDSAGNEIDAAVLESQVAVADGASGAGYGTAELGMLYGLEAVILLMGVVFVRYFLGDGRK